MATTLADMGINDVTAAASSPMAAHLAVGNEAGEVGVCLLTDDETYRCKSLDVHLGPIRKLAFSHDSVSLAVGDVNGSIDVYSLAGNQVARSFTVDATMTSLEARSVPRCRNCRISA
jgi:hypothetical protein